MKSDSRKRKLDEELQDLLPKAEPSQIRVETADARKWRDLSATAQGARAAAFRHQYDLGGGKVRSVVTLHTHGDFNTNPRKESEDSYELSKHNVSTKTEGGAESFGELVTALGNPFSGATNAMRVLKGTHNNYELWHSKKNAEKRAQAAVTLAAEIGISEFSRGGAPAVLNAMSALYLMKRGRMKMEDFSDPKVGYRGAGSGGAARVRALKSEKASSALHLEDLRKEYDSRAVDKVGKPWSGKRNDKGFSEWLEHKSRKWLQRV